MPQANTRLSAGIDSSTQSCKVMIYDEDGQLVRSGRSTHPTGTSVDPEIWWNALLAAGIDAGGLGDVAAAAVAGQQHGLIALDIDGNPVYPALLWNDTRSAPQAISMVKKFGADYLAQHTGCIPVASFTATKLRWLYESHPNLAMKVAAVCLPHDWLTWRLRGYGPANNSQLGPDLTQLSTDRSDASGTNYFDAHDNAYRHEILSWALGRDASTVMVPQILPPDGTAGTTAEHSLNENVVVPQGIVLGSGAGDNAAAAFGLQAGPGVAVVSIGTSGTVFAVSPTPTQDNTGIVAGFADADGQYLPLIATLNAAQVLDGVAELLNIDHTELGRLALKASAGSGGIVLKPYFNGERTPNLPDATASLHGLTLANMTRENIARAAIEGLLCGLTDGLTAITDLGITVNHLVLIGGGAQNPAVQQIFPQVTGLPITVPEPGEYVARGAARAALWTLKGNKPIWHTPTQTQISGCLEPIIREQYGLY